MHAASVNPEPGSNSLKNVYLNPLRDLNPFSELFILASLLLFEFFSSVLTRTTLLSVFSFSRCSIFNDQVLAVTSFLIILHSEEKVNSFFRFFSFFYHFFIFIHFALFTTTFFILLLSKLVV